MSSLLCLGRHTVTGLLTTVGQEFVDWSAAYKLFACDRMPIEGIFSVIRAAVVAELPPQAPLCVAIDDSLLRKTGIRIPGVAWRRDPLGPHFQTNFVLGQRFFQMSASVPLDNGGHRMVPICFSHAPTPVKPSPKAEEDTWKQYRKDAKNARLPVVASQHLISLRQQLDADGVQRQLVVLGDGGYTNETVLKKLPPCTTFIGRIRKDAALNLLPHAPDAQPHRGRPRRYGAAAPTPEQLRTDDSVPWTSVDISLNGIPYSLRTKCLKQLLWRKAGLQHTLQLIVIAPLGYRLRNGSKLLYRKPVYVICTDPKMDVTTVLRHYLQRWDIEVNFREEKTLLGVSQAQVRNPNSAQNLPAFQVAAYAMLLLASLKAAQGPIKQDLLPRPKWQQTSPRFSTARAISQLRAEVWQEALHLSNFSDFATHTPAHTKSKQFIPALHSAVLYACN
ncbi:MAG TPA: transposase [Candidatus Acidoferrum sp.]|jgi:hypothetical protein